MSTEHSSGFTLIEVLIALAITAVVSVMAYTGLSTVMTSAEVLRSSEQRSYEINRAWMIISRDINEFVPRSVRDEFGELEPALAGGELARFPLSLTRAGWHNPAGYPRSNLQRVNYRLEEENLWRDTYPVLDRAGDTEAQGAKLLEGVEYLQVRFLGSIEALEVEGEGGVVDTRNWVENWVEDGSQPGQALAPPVALEVRLQLRDWGEMRRVYALPPL